MRLVFKRKIIQIVASQSSNIKGKYETNCRLFALCNDGTVWVMATGIDGWQQVSEIPQDEGIE
jgi:hypothetical protein